ncbi:MAG: lipopolysaccharide heptosyltransferase I [Desulfobacteraceae bacterium]|nr:lipopolysaccharide heptosyltransferase I [Desulfobacteraceae bacterium]
MIIKTSALGDIIHALPVLDYLHQVAPGVRIDWVVEEAFLELLSGNPLFDRLITVAFKRWKKSPLALETWREVGAVRRRIREREYDLVFDLQGNTKSGLVCWLARSRHKIGFSRDDMQERLNALFTNQKVALHRDDRHATTRYLRIISAPFGVDPSALTLTTDIYTADDDEAAGRMLPQDTSGPVLLFHTGTTWQTKLWHEQGWIALANGLLERYPAAAILLSWGNEQEHETALRIREQVGQRAQVLERMSLKRFAALLKRVDAAVGGDTGPVHLAAAVGTATVSFYRCTDGSLNGPKGENHIIVQSPLACTKCLQKTCERNEECIASITPQAIGAGIDKILQERGFGPA